MLPSLLYQVQFSLIISCFIFTLTAFLILYFLLKNESTKTRFVNYLFLFLFILGLFFLDKNIFIQEKIVIYLSCLIIALFLITKTIRLIKKSVLLTKSLLSKKNKFHFFRKQKKLRTFTPQKSAKKQNPFGSPQVLTSFGLKVRSKSEVFIAEKLYEKKISFKYEQPLSAEGKTYYPDFTLFIGKKEYYWEHFGMMNDEVYAKRTECKIKWYNKNFPKKLIWTEEHSHLMLHINEIVEKIARSKQPPRSYPLSQRNHELKERASQSHRI